MSSELLALGQEARIQRAVGTRQCASRIAGLRCMKLLGHKGQHGNQVWHLVRSARWD